MENFKIKNEFGTITITTDSIRKTVLKGIKRTKSKIVITNSKWTPITRGSSLIDIKESDFIELTIKEQEINVEIYAVIKDDNKPARIVDQLVKNVDEEITKLTGIETNSVIVNLKKADNRLRFRRKSYGI